MYWKQGFYSSNPPNGAIEISTEEYLKLMQGQTDGLTIEECDGKPVLVDRRPSDDALKLAVLRGRRAIKCFSVINRGVLWYNRLTMEQKDELEKWYQAWLDVTETMVEPNMPKWLEEKYD